MLYSFARDYLKPMSYWALDQIDNSPPTDRLVAIHHASKISLHAACINKVNLRKGKTQVSKIFLQSALPPPDPLLTEGQIFFKSNSET
jgi:hypothetical protein